MTMSENKYEPKRKCFKCGKSPAANNIKLFRFPKLGDRNILRCTFWAKYMIPLEENFTSIDFHKKLYSEHRMLCEHNFPKKNLQMQQRKDYESHQSHAGQVSMTLPAYDEPQPGPSDGLEIATGSHQTPLKEIGNIEDRQILKCENPIHNKESVINYKEGATHNKENTIDNGNQCVKCVNFYSDIICILVLF